MSEDQPIAEWLAEIRAMSSATYQAKAEYVGGAVDLYRAEIGKKSLATMGRRMKGIPHHKKIRSTAGVLIDENEF